MQPIGVITFVCRHFASWIRRTFLPAKAWGEGCHTSKQEGGNSRKTSRPEEKGGAKTRQCVACPAVLRSGGSLRQPPYGQTLPVCGRIAGPYRADSCTRHTATQPGLACTPIRPYLHSNQALPALLSGLTCKAEQDSSGHPANAGGRPGRCFSPGDRRERLLIDVTVYVYLRNKNYGVNIYCASCRYLCPTSAGAFFPSRPALRRI